MQMVTHLLSKSGTMWSTKYCYNISFTAVVKSKTFII